MFVFVLGLNCTGSHNGKDMFLRVELHHCMKPVSLHLDIKYGQDKVNIHQDMKDGDKKKIGKTPLGDLYMAVTLKRDRNIVTAKVSLP